MFRFSLQTRVPLSRARIRLGREEGGKTKRTSSALGFPASCRDLLFSNVVFLEWHTSRRKLLLPPWLSRASDVIVCIFREQITLRDIKYSDYAIKYRTSRGYFRAVCNSAKRWIHAVVYRVIAFTSRSQFFFYDLSDRFLIGLSHFSSLDRANDCPFLCDAPSFQYICPANLIEGFDQPNDKHSFDEILQITVNSIFVGFIESNDGLIASKMTWIFIFY